MGGAGLAFAADDGYVTDADLTGTATAAPAQNETLPNDGQLEYQRDSFAAFCHFGPNTFANIEWGESYGNGMPEAYEYMNELSSFDADGYVKMIKDAGFSRLVVTAKHHDGFCIWQSDYTDYDMEKVTNYKNGEGDILADLSAACTKYDIDMGLYLSPWDIHDESYGYDPDKGESVTDGIGTSIDPDVNYNEYYVGQLKEILGNDKYGNKGKFVEVWMDGAKGSGANAQVYDYTRWANTIHELESEDCIIFQCAQHTGVRWIGNENGTSVSTATDELWSPVKLNSAGTDYDPNTQGGVQVGYADGDLWTVPEADARITSGWFWGPNKSTPKSLEDLSAMYFNSIGHGATLLINIPPNDQGTVDSQIKARVEEFASNIKMSFDDNLATGGTAKATSAYGNDATYGPGNVLDGNKDTFWCAADSADQSLIIELGEKQTFDIVSIEEAIQNGQRIDSFKVSYRTDDGSWKEFGSGATIGSKRLVRAAEVSSDAIKIEFGIDEVFSGEQALAQITEVGVYKASPAFEIPTPIPTGLTAIDNTDMTQGGSWTAESISSCYEGTSQWTSNTSSTLTFKFTGTQFNIVGTADPGHGTMGVKIDDGEVIQVATNNVSARNTSALLYSSDTLENKEHTVVISVIRGAVGIDAAAFLPEGMTMVDFETAAFTMDEDSTYELTLRRIGDTSEALTVNVGFEPGTATQDHFDTAAKEVTFAAGEDEATVTVSTRRVTEGEQSSGSADGDRQFYVSLALDGDNVVGGFTDVVTVTITDVDQDLDEVITKAEAVDTDNYTAASVAALNEALEAAKAAYKNAEMSAADVRAAMEALQDAIDNLAAANNYTEEDPFLFPYSDEPATLEFELGQLKDVSNSADSNGKWPAEVWVDTAAGITAINSLNDGDSLSVPFRATYAGTYKAVLTYSSGSTTNELSWSDAKGVVQGGSQAAGASDASQWHEVEFDIVVTEAGSSTLVFAPPAGKNAPRLDKLVITYTGEVPVTEADPTENIALGKDAAASSREDNLERLDATNVTDGNKTDKDNGRWSHQPGEKPAWVYVDLGANYDVQTVRLFWETRKPTDYEVQFALNGADPTKDSSWKTVEELGQPAEKTVDVVLDEAQAARYVRVLINDYVSQDPDGAGNWNNTSLYEIEVYGGILEAEVNYSALNAAIDKAEALTESDYTVDSWSALQTALTAAEAALESDDQSVVDGAAAALEQAIADLVEATEPEPSDDKYTAENPFVFPAEGETATLEFEYGTIHDVSNSADGNGQWPTEVMEDAATGTTLINSLNDGDSLEVPFTVAEAGTYKATLHYSSGSTTNTLAWTDESGIVTSGQQVAGANDEAAAIHTVEFEIVVTEAGSSTLVFASPSGLNAPRLDKLVITFEKATEPEPVEPNYDELNAAIDAAKKLVESDYTADSWSKLETALAVAEQALSATDQTTVDAAAKALNDAIDALVEATEPEPEPTTYTVTFVGAEGVENQTVEEGKTATEPTVSAPAGYTFAGWLLNGEKYDFSTPVTSDIMLTASWSLNAPTVSLAASNESPVEGDIVTITATAEQPAADLTFTYAWTKDGQPIAGDDASIQVTESGSYAVTVTVTDANSASASATSEPVVLTFAPTSEPEPTVDTSKLESEVEQSESLDEMSYTAESWAAFAEALKDAQAVLANEDATQEQVDAALAALSAAREALVTSEPGTDEPGADEPGTDEPGTDEPGTDEPGTDEPGTDEPGTDTPGTDEPGEDVTPGGDDQKPSDDQKPGDQTTDPGSDDTKPSDDQKPSDTVKPGGTQKPSFGSKVPATGDASLPVALVAAGAAGTIAVSIELRRRASEK